MFPVSLIFICKWAITKKVPRPIAERRGSSAIQRKHNHKIWRRTVPRLLKLGIDVGQTSSPNTWQGTGNPISRLETFLHNHADGITSMDLADLERHLRSPVNALCICRLHDR